MDAAAETAYRSYNHRQMVSLEHEGQQVSQLLLTSLRAHRM